MINCRVTIPNTDPLIILEIVLLMSIIFLLFQIIIFRISTMHRMSVVIAIFFSAILERYHVCNDNVITSRRYFIFNARVGRWSDIFLLEIEAWSVYKIY